MSFEDFFCKAMWGKSCTDSMKPYDYQKQIALNGFPQVLNVPTGAGKTAAVVLGWLWRRRNFPDDTPKRLIYCLPMRVLVRQTWENTVLWLNNLGLLRGKARIINNSVQSYDPFDKSSGDQPDMIGVHMLMGGDTDQDWDRYPEQPSILIGTQDMLLSRALNRGYAMSRYRWPIQFALLNNDAFWVMDEIQLMGSGLKTSLQLQAFRELFSTFGRVKTLWMSATVDKDSMHTTDFAVPGSIMELPDNDMVANSGLYARMNAVKQVLDTQISCQAKDYEKRIADFALHKHNPGTITLVVMNTVKRAVDVYNMLKKHKNLPEILLLHSRFRPVEKWRQMSKLLGKPGEKGLIAVTTQVVEAGVDLSARVLITEIAPWHALVQRFGRCNRKGEYRQGEIFYINNVSDKFSAPYTFQELERGLELIQGVHDASPKRLQGIPVSVPEQPTHILRKRDLLDLFDTTPDLTGMTMDVSRFIRSDSEPMPCMIAWKDLGGKEPDKDVRIFRHELCPVPVHEADKFIKKNQKSVWSWNHLDKRWQPLNQAYPGQILVIDVDAGGYHDELGWTGKKSGKKYRIPILTPTNLQKIVIQGYDEDLYQEQRTWQTIAEHTERVFNRLQALLKSISLPIELRNDLENAAKWHDAGKAHEVFQEAISKSAPTPSGPWAKSGTQDRITYSRKGFRHELASALAVLGNKGSDLTAYLVAAHHGKVRMSIRSMPYEHAPHPGDLFARGIWQGDKLPATQLYPGLIMPETSLELSYMEMGVGKNGPSWVSRTQRLLKKLGPFKLAFLEAVLRLADWRA